MIPEIKFQEVRRLLSQGKHSHRQIARLVDVCRVTVDKIAAGKRPDYAERRRLKTRDRKRPQDTGPLVRCPDCGGLVQLPCRLCRIRAFHQGELAMRRAARLAAQQTAAGNALATLRRRPLQRPSQDSASERRAG